MLILLCNWHLIISSAKEEKRRIKMIKPLYERVLLEKVEVKSETSSGILLPESSQDSSSMAKVIAKGEGHLNDDGNLTALPLEIGDVVIYKEYATTEVKYQGQDFLLIDMKDILAIVEEA